MSARGSVWKSKVDDAKKNGCFFNVEEIKDLAKFVKEVKKELDEFDEMLDAESSLFKNAKWKVLTILLLHVIFLIKALCFASSTNST